MGLDASVRGDYTALVGCVRDAKSGDVHVTYVKTWKPQKGALQGGKPTIDLRDVVDEIKRLHEQGRVSAVVYDPFQLHLASLQLEAAGVNVVEMPQTNARVASDQALYDAIVAKRIKHYGDPHLDEAIHNAVAVESARGLRLSKSKTSKKIDAAVALSMAAYHVASVGIPTHWPEQVMKGSRRTPFDHPGAMPDRQVVNYGRRWRDF